MTFIIVDSDECSSMPCLNSGTCYEQLHGYICSCIDGYEGRHCESGEIICLALVDLI